MPECMSAFGVKSVTMTMRAGKLAFLTATFFFCCLERRSLMQCLPVKRITFSLAPVGNFVAEILSKLRKRREFLSL